MGAVRDFIDLDAWKTGHELVLGIYRATMVFPKEEMYGLVSQMRRAAVSITSNIAEGFSRRSLKDKVQFYRVARGSLTELQNQLFVSRDVGFLQREKCEDLEKRCTSVHKLLNALIASLDKYTYTDGTPRIERLKPKPHNPTPNPQLLAPNPQLPTNGFTLPELIVVIGLLGLLFALGLPASRNFYQARGFDAAVREFLGNVRRAQIRSLDAEGGSNVGVRLIAGTSTAYTVFLGKNYAGRDAGKDEAVTLPPFVGISFVFPGATSTYDLIFSRVRGKPAASGTITLSEELGGSLRVTVGAEGLIQVE